MKRKVLSLLLVMAMGMSLLVGCGDENKDSGNDTNISQTDEDDANVIQKSQVNWLKSNRLNTSTVETFKIELDDRSVTCEAIYGEIDGDSYIYLISTIDFKYDDNIVNVFQVTYEDDYDDYKEEFKQILIDAKTLD